MKMKRVFSLTMAATMLFSATAFGATTTIDQIDPSDIVGKNTNDKYDVSYEDAQQGKEYMLWALKGVYTDVEASDFAQGNVLYVDQETGGASGVSYDGFLPMKSTDSTLVITGQGMEKPVIIGYIKGEGRVLKGTIGMLQRTRNLGGITLTFTGSNGQEISVDTDANNKFEITVPADTYTLTIAKDGYLAYVDGAFVVDDETEWTKEITLLPGDVKKDGVITPADLLEFKKLYQQRTDMTIDFDGTGVISGGDLICFKAAWAIKSYN